MKQSINLYGRGHLHSTYNVKQDDSTWLTSLPGGLGTCLTSGNVHNLYAFAAACESIAVCHVPPADFQLISLLHS